MSRLVDIRFPPILGRNKFFEPAEYKVLYGGRGSGKSWSVAHAVLILGMQKPMRILCAREIQRSLEASVKQLLEDRIDFYGLRGTVYNSTNTEIRGVNGTSIKFAGLRTNPETVKSMEGLDLVWIEEADRVSQRSLDILDPTLRKEGAELWFTFNPRLLNDPVYDMFLGGAPPSTAKIINMNWRDNPWFTGTSRTKMEWMKKRDHDKYLHVWEGRVLRRTEALVLTNWVEDDLDHRVPDTCLSRFGADWGMADPTVLMKVYRWDRVLYVKAEAHKIGATIDETPSLFVGDDPRTWVAPERKWPNKFDHAGIEGAFNSKIIGDSASPQTIRYLKDRDFSIVPAIKGPGSLEEGVEFLQSHDIVVHPSCQNLQDELDSYSYKVDDQTDEILPELDDKDNHCIDALRYALEGERRAKRRKAASMGGYHTELIIGPQDNYRDMW